MMFKSNKVEVRCGNSRQEKEGKRMDLPFRLLGKAQSSAGSARGRQGRGAGWGCEVRAGVRAPPPPEAGDELWALTNSERLPGPCWYSSGALSVLSAHVRVL